MIVDASVAFKWLFREDGSDAAAALIGGDALCAPSLLLIEIANAVWKKGRKGELTERADYAAKLSILASLVTVIQDDDVISRALEMALQLDHPVYDCVYLAMAEARDETLVSADQRFLDKVKMTEFAALMKAL